MGSGSGGPRGFWLAVVVGGTNICDILILSLGTGIWQIWDLGSESEVVSHYDYEYEVRCGSSCLMLRVFVMRFAGGLCFIFR